MSCDIWCPFVIIIALGSGLVGGVFFGVWMGLDYVGRLYDLKRKTK